MRATCRGDRSRAVVSLISPGRSEQVCAARLLSLLSWCMGVYDTPTAQPRMNNMADVFTKKHRSKIMGRIGSKDTQPEMRVRRALYRLGLRYRLHGVALPGKPDVVMRKWKTVIYVHGCFWHGHDCKRGSAARRPKTNEAYWNPKIDGNVKRDADHLAAVRAQGWRAVVIWDCETANPEVLEARLRALFAIGDGAAPAGDERGPTPARSA